MARPPPTPCRVCSRLCVSNKFSHFRQKIEYGEVCCPRRRAAKRLVALDHGELQRVASSVVGTEKLAAVMVVFDPDSVSNIGSAYGWWRHDYQWSQGELIIMRKDDHNGAPMLFHLDGPLEPSDTTIT